MNAPPQSRLNKFPTLRKEIRVSTSLADEQLRSEPSTLSNIDLHQVVSRLRESREILHNVRHLGRVRHLPSLQALGDVLDGLSAALFPSHYASSDLTDESVDYFVGATLSQTLSVLAEQIRRGLLVDNEAAADIDGTTFHAEAIGIARKFALKLPAVRALLVSDLKAAYAGDPAAKNYPEILLGYPGMTAIIHHRLAHELFRLGARLPARLISHISHSKTGIDIHPGAVIGESFFIDHGTGVVIGETAVVGDRVRLYQAVTLGAKSFTKEHDGTLLKGQPRHPIVEDDVIIYAGATILGRVTIGEGAVIGGNVWLTRNVPAGSHISQIDTELP
jgi:serine O-acetyltransferase